MSATAEITTLHCLASAKVFPGRTSLYPHEVSRALRMSVNQVIDLIDEKVIAAVRINSPDNKSTRSNYRIPVAEYDRFVLQGGTQPRINGHSRNGHSNGKATR